MDEKYLWEGGFDSQPTSCTSTIECLPPFCLPCTKYLHSLIYWMYMHSLLRVHCSNTRSMQKNLSQIDNVFQTDSSLPSLQSVFQTPPSFSTVFFSIAKRMNEKSVWKNLPKRNFNKKKCIFQFINISKVHGFSFCKKEKKCTVKTNLEKLSA